MWRSGRQATSWSYILTSCLMRLKAASVLGNLQGDALFRLRLPRVEAQLRSDWQLDARQEDKLNVSLYLASLSMNMNPAVENQY